MANNDKLWVLGHRITPVKVSGNYDMVIGETGPNVPGPPPHYHAKMNEVFMVIDGGMEFMVNGKVTHLKTGDSIDLPFNAVHTFKNVGAVPCKWINIHSPKGFLSFFEDMGISEDETDALLKSVDSKLIERVMKEAVNYDMHITV